MSPGVSSSQRFTADDPCPICGGHERMPRGGKGRCAGFYNRDRSYANCTSEAFAGGLEAKGDPPSYGHRLKGPCRCGQQHGAAIPAARVLEQEPEHFQESFFKRCPAPYPCDYRSESGAVLYRVARWPLPDGRKTYSYYRPDGSGEWIKSLTDELKAHRVVLDLPEIRQEIAEGRSIVVAEGEGKARMLRALGFAATASDGGAEGFKPQHAECLRGARRVYLILDNDAVGLKRGERVPALIHAVGIPDIRVVLLPGLKWAERKGEGVDDWIRQRQSHTPGRIRAELETFLKQPAPWSPKPAADTLAVTVAHAGDGTYAQQTPANSGVLSPEHLIWRPFPVGALPPGCRRFAIESAKARGLDPAFVAAPMLAALSGAIGNSRRLRIKRTYTEPAVLWVAVVARSGVGKSSPHDDLLAPHRAKDKRLAQENEASLEDHWRALVRHEADKSDYRKARKKDSTTREPDRPDLPPQRALLVEDVTVEALAERLADNPRGMLLARDELSGWVASFDAYKNARGADVGHYLSMHRAGSLVVDRKDRRRPRITVERAALSIVGTIQPRVLARVVRSEHRENGLLARLLVAMPKERVPLWNENDVEAASFAGYGTVIDSLLDLLEGEVDLHLSADALAAYRAFHDEVAEQASEQNDDLFAALAKVRGAALRLALVLALARAAERARLTDLREVDLEAMEGGIALARWFGNEAARVYAVLAESPEEREVRRHIQWIADRGTVTPRELCRSGPRPRFSNPEDAELFLRKLVRLGWGTMEDRPIGPSGGRPGAEFKLYPRGDETPESAGENGGMGSVASLVEPENESSEVDEIEDFLGGQS